MSKSILVLNEYEADKGLSVFTSVKLERENLERIKLASY